MQLYFHPQSPNCVKVLFGAELMGLSLEHEQVDLMHGAQRQPPFRRLNPNGKVPVLVDGDFVLWESHAILQYLAIGAGAAGARVWPDDHRTRSSIERWMCWSLTELSPVVRPFQWENLFKPRLTGDAPNPAVLEAAIAPLQSVVSVLDDVLSVDSHISGDTLTLADVAIASTLMYADAARMPLESFEHVRRWLENVRSTPAWMAAQPFAGAA
jgi:glutathione S-transferase